MNLSQLKRPKGAVKAPRRVGRGDASGQGVTAGKGHKGHRARAGKNKSAGFEGGQMPLYRRLPKRGFRKPDHKEYAIVNVGDLSRFEAGRVIDPELLLASRVIRNLGAGLKILSVGELTTAFTVKAHKFSEKAKEKILAAGGTVELIKG